MHLVMAQRLVRRLDDGSKQPYQPDDKLKVQLKTVLDTLPPNIEKPNLDNVTLYKAGKSEKNPFGYQGQIAIREQLKMTPSVQDMLRLPPEMITTEALEKRAVQDGMKTMLHDGILKVLNGETTLEEVYRVVG
jgi:general secretion pathway protein E